MIYKQASHLIPRGLKVLSKSLNPFSNIKEEYAGTNLLINIIIALIITLVVLSVTALMAIMLYSKG